MLSGEWTSLSNDNDYRVHSRIFFTNIMEITLRKALETVNSVKYGSNHFKAIIHQKLYYVPGI